MPEPFTATDQRAQHRSNLFVIAALHCPGADPLAPVRVRVRNLSPEGALIEGSPLPEIGTSVRLTRGRLSAVGELRWCDGHRAGLRFSSPVRVADWLPGAHQAGQQRVDEILFEARAGSGPGSAAPAVPGQPDYAELARALTKAGEELAADPGIAGRHPGALQAIDIAAQALARLAKGQ